MSLLALLAHRATEQATPVPVPRPVSSLVAPYNAPDYLRLPTPYPNFSATHPSVVDFGAQKWNGWRYWMAYTPYYAANAEIENPIIVVSDDRETWQYPAGITNPIEPWPGAGFNSDTELVWDDSTNKLWCIWRTVLGSEPGESIRAKTSTDGVHWSERIELFRTTGEASYLSPTVVKGHDGRWHMYYVSPEQAGDIGLRTASDLAGPWTPHQPVAIHYNGASGPWHIYMRREGDQYRMLLNCRFPVWGLMPAVSTDGVEFWGGPQVLKPTLPWEEDRLYRSCMVPADNGADYDVWYAATGSGWQVAHTRIPQRHWDVLG